MWNRPVCSTGEKWSRSELQLGLLFPSITCLYHWLVRASVKTKCISYIPNNKFRAIQNFEQSTVQGRISMCKQTDFKLLLFLGPRQRNHLNCVVSESQHSTPFTQKSYNHQHNSVTIQNNRSSYLPQHTLQQYMCFRSKVEQTKLLFVLFPPFSTKLLRSNLNYFSVGNTRLIHAGFIIICGNAKRKWRQVRQVSTFHLFGIRRSAALSVCCFLQRP